MGTSPESIPSAPGDRPTVVATQKERFGGIKWGSAFFGWLTATGMALLLTAIAAAAGSIVGLGGAPGGPAQALEEAIRDPARTQTIGVTGAIILLVIVLVAYYCGGYVAGRMARFAGAKQGVAVWLWAVVIAVVVALAGARLDVLAGWGGLPRLPLEGGTLTTTGVIAAVVALVAGLVGAVLGGLAGMHYHRKVDRTATVATPPEANSRPPVTGETSGRATDQGTPPQRAP